MPAITVADVELDFARLLRWLDQPLPLGGHGALSSKDRDCQEACDEEDGGPHRDPRRRLTSWIGRPPKRLQRLPHARTELYRFEGVSLTVWLALDESRQPSTTGASP